MPKETRTYRDHKAYLARLTNVRRRKLKRLMVDYKGGRCEFCGYSQYIGALDFHHIDEKQKEFGLSIRGLTRSLVKVKKEVDKCLLACANCHREIYGGLIKSPSA